jgi:hypothetical protein
MLGEEMQGLEALRNGYDFWLSHGGKFHASQFASRSAIVLLERGYMDEAWRFLRLGEQMQADIEESWHKAELLRIRGRLSELQSEGLQDAERLYRQAIVVADEQGARLLKLRAATDLARCMKASERTQEANSLLQPIIGECVEGFELPDLKYAQAVLDQLSV